MEYIEFCKAVLKHWWVLMSCAVFTLLGLYGAWANKSNAWVVRGILAAATCLLLWSCFLTWRDEWRNRTLLETTPGVKEQVTQLSQSVLDYIFERIQNAPPVSTPGYDTSDGRLFLRDMRQHDHEARTLKSYEYQTLEIYEYKYLPAVMSAIASLKGLGLDCSTIDESLCDLESGNFPTRQGLIIPTDGYIKGIGKQLRILADQITEP